MMMMWKGMEEEKLGRRQEGMERNGWGGRRRKGGWEGWEKGCLRISAMAGGSGLPMPWLAAVANHPADYLRVQVRGVGKGKEASHRPWGAV